MENKQTAVDYFAQWVSYHKLNQNLTLERLDELITNAKQMEREQIEDAHIEGQRVFDKHLHTEWTNNQAEQYYNETYGK